MNAIRSMSKVNEPIATYYSAPQISALKKRLKASIEQENDVEVLLHYESLMCAHSAAKYDEAYFTKLEAECGAHKGSSMPCNFTEDELDDVVRSSERSGVVDNDEIKAFFARWESMS